MLIINENKVSQVVCLSCLRRWIAARPANTRLDELQCPDCKKMGFAIETGEVSIAEELLKQTKDHIEETSRQKEMEARAAWLKNAKFK